MQMEVQKGVCCTEGEGDRDRGPLRRTLVFICLETAQQQIMRELKEQHISNLWEEISEIRRKYM